MFLEGSVVEPCSRRYPWSSHATWRDGWIRGLIDCKDTQSYRYPLIYDYEYVNKTNLRSVVIK